MTKYFVHKSSIVDEGAIIGEGTKIWQWCHVSSSAAIGAHCSLGQNVFIADNVTIGEGVKIQNNVSVFEGVTLEDGVFCGPSMTFTNVSNPRSEFPRNKDYEKTIVKRGASFGANSTVVCGVTVGQYAFVGAGSVVTKDLPDFAMVVGIPARQIGWMSKSGIKLELPLSGDAQIVVEDEQIRYVLSGNTLVSQPL